MNLSLYYLCTENQSVVHIELGIHVDMYELNGSIDFGIAKAIIRDALNCLIVIKYYILVKKLLEATCSYTYGH